MKNRLPSILLNLLIVALVIVAAILATRTQASEPGSLAQPVTEAAPVVLQSSNYCVSCHPAGDERLTHATEWRGGIAAAASSPCPAYLGIQQELYYTERLLLMIDRARTQIPASSSLDSRVQAGQEGYLRLLDAPVTSLDGFVAEAQSLRYKLGKIYTEINQTIDQGRRTRSAFVGVALSLLIALSLGWGWYNTRRFPGGGLRSQGWTALASKGFLVLLIFAFFTLPILQEPAQPATVTTALAQTIQTTLDTAQRAATAADRTLARAGMLGRVSAVWSRLDPHQGSARLDEALQAASQASNSDPALWGQAAAAQEAAVSVPISRENAGLISEQFNATRSRAWALRFIAHEWAAVDAQTAQAILSQGMKTAQRAQGAYRDLDLQGLAVETAAFDPDKAGQIAGQIEDPAVRAWAWREIAVQTGSPQGYEQAAAAGREIAYPPHRALALGRIAAASQDQALFGEAWQSLEGRNDEASVYARSNLIVWSQEAAWVEQIPAGFPAARAIALTGLAQYEAAWQESVKIADPYERARAQGEIVAGWAKVEPAKAAEAARTIGVSLLKERALKAIALATGDASLVNEVHSPYLQIQALTGLGQVDQAQAVLLANPPKESYPIVGLALAKAKEDPQAALALVDQISREADRSTVLNVIASQTLDPAIFERALGMAMAARVREDALAPARASLDLAMRFLQTDPAKALTALEQAYQITRTIATK